MKQLNEEGVLCRVGRAFKKFLSADLQAQVEACFRDERLVLTDEGREELLELLADMPEVKEAFTARAKEKIEENN